MGKEKLQCSRYKSSPCVLGQVLFCSLKKIAEIVYFLVHQDNFPFIIQPFLAPLVILVTQLNSKESSTIVLLFWRGEAVFFFLTKCNSKLLPSIALLSPAAANFVWCCIRITEGRAKTWMQLTLLGGRTGPWDTCSELTFQSGTCKHSWLMTKHARALTVHEEHSSWLRCWFCQSLAPKEKPTQSFHYLK